ncbi:uncharacterized protein Dwil_GK27604 [Drosophila willistoni]|uniref:Single domain-containing protein n=1 Tax=Drosophila willistoni TaxID=7260 RepID=A0A0Q9X147_DROWI|nr:uncharacterized protein LOC26529606 [Drosophila willistoni]KRF98742.1 uncharacterized protein Dwil_GK27604 [Drosophila willistoni]
MNKMFLGFLLLYAIFCFLGTSEAAVAFGVFKDPAHPGKCVVESLILSPGQSGRHPSMCARVNCLENSVAQIHTCGAVGLPPGSTFGDFKNPNADYPTCCDRHIIKAN